MVEEVEIFTQIFPSADSGSGQQDPEYPAPYDLVITDDYVVGQNRTVILSWNAPIPI
ncbi:MAG: hypothetical protein U5N58_09590 [Actinomycetota bacterium]|nr:hypothetical protein [Actinomycetota bacterium]